MEQIDGAAPWSYCNRRSDSHAERRFQRCLSVVTQLQRSDWEEADRPIDAMLPDGLGRQFFEFVLLEGLTRVVDSRMVSIARN